ncbi:MAG: tetratricopeptide repeat protein [Anaerolineales bacterium]
MSAPKKKTAKTKDEKVTEEPKTTKSKDSSGAQELLHSGWAHRVKHELDEAESDFRKGLQQLPNDAYGNYGLAQVLMEQGNKSEATEFFQRVAKLVEDGAFKDDRVRANMLHRQALGHIERIKTGEWDLSSIGGIIPKSS